LFAVFLSLASGALVAQEKPAKSASQDPSTYMKVNAPFAQTLVVKVKAAHDDQIVKLGIHAVPPMRLTTSSSPISLLPKNQSWKYKCFSDSLQRNVSRDLSLSANYEWSHSIDNGGIGGGEADTPQNMACLRCERASSDQDMRSYLSASTIWQLPIGRGRRFMSTSSRIADLFLGGWQLSAIGSARSGLPLNVTLSRNASALPDQLNKNQRPNIIPGASLYPTNKSPQNWLNYAASKITPPPSFSLEAVVRTSTHCGRRKRPEGHGLKRYMNSAILRPHPIYSRSAMSMRMDMFYIVLRRLLKVKSASRLRS
jgi:hypothetical protein